GAIGLAPVPGWVGFAFASVGVGLALGSELIALQRVRQRRRFAGTEADFEPGGGPPGTTSGAQPPQPATPGMQPPGRSPPGMPPTPPPSERPHPGGRRPVASDS
ncbi:MAG: hypothetical protein ACXVHI_02530, partial [Frankiaceae bacterium]